MSQHQAFKRVAVPAQVAAKLETVTLAAPTRGIILNENEAYTQPGAAVVCDNWKPTMNGVSLRGGCDEWCQLPETTPVISGFDYVSGVNHQMFAANLHKIYNVSTTVPLEVASGRNSGNNVASQLANQGGDFMLVANDAGDPLLRYNGVTWTSLATTTPADWSVGTPYAVGATVTDPDAPGRWENTVAHTSPASGTFAAYRTANPGHWIISMAGDDNSWITGPPGSRVENGANLSYVCKYRNRYFFVELNSMNAWYLPLNAVGGTLQMIPLSGAATKGGRLMFCASWSIDAGDGIDDKICFVTNEGEAIIFTGGDPSSAANWRQEGRYMLSPPLGMNAHLAIGGDLLVATVDGILPMSGAITKDRAELELAAITRQIKKMWRVEVLDKREHHWSMFKWDEYGGIFTTLPGGKTGQQRCLVVNAATGAWARFTGWDAMCFMRMRGDMFFGTQTGQIVQADRTGYDLGLPYVAVLVGGWEMFASPSQTITWRQSRVSFRARAGEPFQPQVSATTDYVVTLPPPPPAGADTGLLDLWDEGLWDTAVWDAGTPPQPVVRNTGWVSIGMTGYSHAPVVQVTVAQNAKPEVDLISIAATFERVGVNV
jgi:hypothetical protein